MKRIATAVFVLIALATATAWGQTNLIATLAAIPGLADSPEKGVFVDLVKAIDEVYTEGTIEIQVVPFARSFQMMMTGASDFHVPSFIDPNIPASEIPFGHVPEPMGKVKLLIYSNAAKPITAADIKAAITAGGEFPYVIEVGGGTELNFPFPTVGSNSDAQSLRKVNAGRIDAYIWPPEGDIVVRDEKLKNLHREIYAEFDDVVLVAKSPRGEQVAQILDAAMKELKRQGRLKQYHDRVHFPYEDWQPHLASW